MRPVTIHKAKWLLVGLVLIGGVASWLVYAPDQGAKWESYISAGEKAYHRADYAEADKQFEAALKEAEGFGPQDPRLAKSVNNLAALYHTQGKYAEAEPLHQRSLAIREKALGPEHPNVATSLNNLAALYEAQGANAASDRMSPEKYRTAFSGRTCSDHQRLRSSVSSARTSSGSPVTARA